MDARVRDEAPMHLLGSTPTLAPTPTLALPRTVLGLGLLALATLGCRADGSSTPTTVDQPSVSANAPVVTQSCGDTLTPLSINDTTTVCVLASSSSADGTPQPKVYSFDQCPAAFGSITADNTCAYEGGFQGLLQHPSAEATYFTQLPYTSGACNLSVDDAYLQGLLGGSSCQSAQSDGCSGIAAVNPLLWGYSVLTPTGVGLQLGSITVTQGGSGYTSAPTVSFIPVTATGSGAQATATVRDGAVVQIDVTDPGSDYTLPPVVQLTGGGGSGAQATSTVAQLGGWGCTESAAPQGGTINPYAPGGVAYLLQGPTGNTAQVAVVDRCGGTVQMSNADDGTPVREAPSDCPGFQAQQSGGACAFTEPGNAACGCGDSNRGFAAPSQAWSALTPWAPGVGTAPPLYPEPTPSCDSVQCVDWCAVNNHPHFDLDQATFSWLCGSTAAGSCTLSAVTPFVPS